MSAEREDFNAMKLRLGGRIIDLETELAAAKADRKNAVAELEALRLSCPHCEELKVTREDCAKAETDLATARAENERLSELLRRVKAVFDATLPYEDVRLSIGDGWVGIMRKLHEEIRAALSDRPAPATEGEVEVDTLGDCETCGKAISTGVTVCDPCFDVRWKETRAIVRDEALEEAAKVVLAEVDSMNAPVRILLRRKVAEVRALKSSPQPGAKCTETIQTECARDGGHCYHPGDGPCCKCHDKPAAETPECPQHGGMPCDGRVVDHGGPGGSARWVHDNPGRTHFVGDGCDEAHGAKTVLWCDGCGSRSATIEEDGTCAQCGATPVDVTSLVQRSGMLTREKGAWIHKTAALEEQSATLTRERDSLHSRYRGLYALWCRVARAMTPNGGPDITDEEVASRAESVVSDRDALAAKLAEIRKLVASQVVRAPVTPMEATKPLWEVLAGIHDITEDSEPTPDAGGEGAGK